MANLETSDRKKTITVAEAAEALGIGRNAAYEAVKNGAIPSIRLGGRIVIPVAPFRKMLGIEDKAIA